MSPAVEILQGTLELLILKTLALEPMHGWGIAQRIQQVSRDILQIQPGACLAPRSIACNARNGSARSGALPKIIAAPSSTPSPKPVASNSKKK
jgi:hypothetical protein